jgi:hypothetical protein
MAIKWEIFPDESFRFAQFVLLRHGKYLLNLVEIWQRIPGKNSCSLLAC